MNHTRGTSIRVYFFLRNQNFLYKWPGHQDSNLDQRIQSPLCCRCTMPQKVRNDSNTFIVFNQKFDELDLIIK